MADVEHRSKESEPQSTPSGSSEASDRGTSTVRAQFQAQALAKVAQRINPIEGKTVMNFS